MKNKSNNKIIFFKKTYSADSYYLYVQNMIGTFNKIFVSTSSVFYIHK